MNISELTYRGERVEDGEPVVTVQVGNAQPTALDPRLDLRSHSPSGLNWGYPGSGPSQLALAIIASSCGDGIAQRIYQTFKFENVANWQEDSFTLTGKELLEWLEEKGLSQERIGMAKAIGALGAATAQACDQYVGMEEGGDAKDERAAKAYDKLLSAKFDLQEALNIASAID